MDSTKACQGCTQQIHADATRCPHCQARQSVPLHRGHPGRMVAGVCGALARQLGIDVSLIRVAFALTALISGGMAFGLYLLLWVLTPSGPGRVAPAARWMDSFNKWGSASPSGHPIPEPPEAVR